MLPGNKRRSPGIEVVVSYCCFFQFQIQTEGMNNSFFHHQHLKIFFSSWFINKNEKTVPVKINLFDTQDHLLSLLQKMSKTLHTHNILFHKNVHNLLHKDMILKRITEETLVTLRHQMYLLNYQKTLWPLVMDGVQLPQGCSHFEEAVYFLPLSSQKFLVLILSTLEGWKAELTLEPPSGFEHGTPGLGIQCFNH